MPPPNSVSRPLILLLMLLIFMPFSVSSAIDKGTIRLKTGEEYMNVPFKVNNIYKTVQFEFEGRKIHASFSDIESITDRNGNDITSRVLGKNYHPSGETWLSESSEEVKIARAKPWEFALGFIGNVSMPAGDWYEGFETGIGYGGDLKVALNHQLALQFIVSRSGIKPSDDIYLVSLDPSYSIIDSDIDASAVRYIVALDYYQPFSRTGVKPDFWYLYSGMGIVNHTTRVRATVRYTNGFTQRIDETDSMAKFVIALGFGGVKMLNNTIGLDASGNFDLVHAGTVEGTYGNTVVYGYLFDLRIGAVVVF